MVAVLVTGKQRRQRRGRLQLPIVSIAFLIFLVGSQLLFNSKHLAVQLVGISNYVSDGGRAEVSKATTKRTKEKGATPTIIAEASPLVASTATASKVPLVKYGGKEKNSTSSASNKGPATMKMNTTASPKPFSVAPAYEQKSIYTIEDPKPSSLAPVISRVTERSNGTDLFENVCLVHKDGGVTIVSSTKLVRPRIPRLHVFWASYTRQPTAVSDFPDVAANAKWISEETLFLINLFSNPGHCLNDLGFSLAMELNGDNDNSNGTTTSRTVPLFPQFAYLSTANNLGRLAKSCDASFAYCCHLMEVFGMIDPPQAHSFFSWC
jgi:hypothetical protein